MTDKSTSVFKYCVAGTAAGVGVGLLLSKYLYKRSKNHPYGYQVPDVWQNEDSSGSPFASINRPTSGARSEKALPVGQHPYQLYSLGTPNGVKVTCFLEELYDACGIEYDAWRVNIMQLEQFTSGFVAINPNSKIPAMTDNSVSPPIRVFESGSILLYLADKHKKFIPTDPRGRAECLNWLFWQMGSAPYIGGGFGHFYKYCDMKFQYAIDRFTMETKRQLDVLNQRLAVSPYLAGDEYTIADMAVFPWIGCLDTGYGAKKFLDLDSYTHVTHWLARINARPAVKRGKRVNSWGPDAVEERHSFKDFA